MYKLLQNNEILKALKIQLNNENREVCSKCQGKCCKTMGCHYSPRDFEKITKETLRDFIKQGFVSIDWWEGDVLDTYERYRSCYLRIRNRDIFNETKLAPIVDPSYGGKCMLLTENGCLLKFEDRPMGGRNLIPKSKDEKYCQTTYSKKDAAIEWYPYNDILEELIEEFK